ncbi:hypothetical protein N7456_001267 [Penicillium angulare]|uniref:Uncharacterized protein n=1 Tax=Penicillium angulare TaxID=116970 RepID=A0A9W9GDP1_9EURO|nr:hypothetical protein N7456_001267 [Penicillium angulare]
MHRYQLIQALLLGLGSASQVARRDDSSQNNASLNFRPDAISGLGNLYKWVGSYYNATTQVEFWPYAGVASSANDSSSICPNLKNQKYSFDFDSVLAITETSEYNVGANPINLFLVGWPEHGTLNQSRQIGHMNADEWDFFSSTPEYSYNASSKKAETNFNLTMQDPHSAPYNLSSTLSEYYGQNEFVFNMTDCNSTDTTQWVGTMIVDSIMNQDGYNWTYPNPTLDVQFDSTTANLTLEGYFQGAPIGQGTFRTDELIVPGKLKLSFGGKIDTYHSDVLVNDSSTPSWERTVGFNNNSANIGYNGTDSDDNASSKLRSSQTLSVIGLTLMLSLGTMYM